MNTFSLTSFSKYTVLGSSFFLCVFVFSACLGKAPSAPATTADSAPAAQEKSGFSTLSGTVMISGTTPLLKTSKGTTSLESYDLDLKPYNGQKVTVTGKYSGDTLFVSEITATP